MSDEMPRRITILDTRIDLAQKMLYWKVRFHDNEKEITLAYPQQDLLDCLGIHGSPTDQQMQVFCNDMIGKEINIIMTATVKELPDISNMTDNQFDEFTNDLLSDYPIYEIMNEGKTEDK